MGEETHWHIHTIDGEVHTLRLELWDKRQLANLDPPMLLIADRPTQTAASKLLQDRVNFVDRAGNLRLFLGERYFAHVQGKQAPRRLPAMRAPAYRVLLAWLIDPELLGAPLRGTASTVNVSRTAVQHMRARLAEWGYVVGSGNSRVWTARGKKEARRMWLEGYRTTLRPGLDLGGFRLKNAGSKTANLTHVRRVLAQEWSRQVVGDQLPRWRWGGTEALGQIAGTENHFVHGPPVVALAVDPRVVDVSGILPIVRSEIYNIRLRRLPIVAAADHGELEGWPASVPHPLMVWSELMCSSDPRVHEAAEELANVAPPGWS